MAMDWNEINERRISEITQEIRLYCAQKKSIMTPRAFDRARRSFDDLLDNIAQRNPKSIGVVKSLKKSMERQEECIADCSELQAKCLARGVVYNKIGNDLQLYPITAKKKISLALARGLKECDIPIDEMTDKDIIYVASAITEGERLSKATTLNVFNWFKERGLEPMETRVFAYMYKRQVPVSIKSLPQQEVLGAEYRNAAKSLVDKGFIRELPDNMYFATETITA